MFDAGHPQEGPGKQSGGPDPVFVPNHCLPRKRVLVVVVSTVPGTANIYWISK